MKSYILTFLSAILFTENSYAATQTPDSLFLKCSAKKFVNDQPCGGQNSKDLKVFFSVNGEFKDSGYKMNQMYGGCYSTTEEHFGTVRNIHVSGNKVHLTLRYVGSMSIGGIPSISTDTNEIYEIDAVYDSRSQKMELDLGRSRHQYMEPKVLDCSSLFD